MVVDYDILPMLSGYWFDDVDFNNSRLGQTVADRNDKLVKILNTIGDLPLGNYQDNKIDAFGDAYEYLINMYASNAGKSGGEFFVPQEVSELLARLSIGNRAQVNKVYDIKTPRLIQFNYSSADFAA